MYDVLYIHIYQRTRRRREEDKNNNKKKKEEEQQHGMEESSARLQRLLETTTNSTRKDESDFTKKSDDGNAIESMPYATAATVAAEYTKRIRHLEKELRDAHLLVSEGNAAKHSSATTGVELEKARERIGHLEQSVVMLTKEKDEARKQHRDAEQAYAELFEKASNIDGAKDTAIRNAKRDIEKNLHAEYTQKMDEYERRVEEEMKEFREQQIKQVHEAILDAHFSVPEREKMKEDHEEEVARLKTRVDETVEFHVREEVNKVKSEYEKKFLEQAIEVREKAEENAELLETCVRLKKERDTAERLRQDAKGEGVKFLTNTLKEMEVKHAEQQEVVNELRERERKRAEEKIDEMYAEANRQLSDEREQFKMKFEKQRKFMTEELEQARDEAKEAALKLTNHHEEMKEKMHDLTLKSQDLIDQNARLRAVVKTFEDYVEELEEREARLEMYQSKLVGAKETIEAMKEIMADDKHKIGQAVSNIMRNVSDVKAWATGIRSKLTLAGADSVDVQRAMVSFEDAMRSVDRAIAEVETSSSRDSVRLMDIVKRSEATAERETMDMRSGRSVRKSELQKQLLAASDGDKITALADAHDGFQGYVEKYGLAASVWSAGAVERPKAAAAASSSYFGGLFGG